MIVVIQRCSEATVLIKNKVFSKIDNGLMILLGIKKGDQINDADKIIVIDNGMIIDSGNHNELISKCEIYKNLHKLQFETGN